MYLGSRKTPRSSFMIGPMGDATSTAVDQMGLIQPTVMVPTMMPPTPAPATVSLKVANVPRWAYYVAGAALAYWLIRRKEP